MLLAAAADWHLALNRSLIVGDKESDIQAAAAAGVPLHYKVGAQSADPTAILVADLAAALEHHALHH